MKTVKQHMEEGRAELDAAWKAKYPRGRWIFHHMNRGGFGYPISDDETYIELAVEFSRRTSRVVPRAFVLQRDHAGRITTPRYVNNCFGLVRSFTSREALVAYAERKGVPADVMQAFLTLTEKAVR